MPYDNFKSYQKPWFHPLFRRYNFRKTTWGVKLTSPRSRFTVKNPLLGKTNCEGLLLNIIFNEVHKKLISPNRLSNIFLDIILIPLLDTYLSKITSKTIHYWQQKNCDINSFFISSQGSNRSNVSKWPLFITSETYLRMLKVVDKQAILIIKQVVIVETIITTKERTFAIYFIFFFHLDSLSRTFMIHRTAGEGGGYFFKFSLPLLPASQTLRH